MGYKLFLDDVRNPVHCLGYMYKKIGRLNPIYLENDWAICRNYNSFVETIKKMGLPEFVSFDHDLSDEHYGIQVPESMEEYDSWEGREESGYDCAKWLVNYCMDNKVALPPYAIHSMNPVGAERIANYLKNAEKWIKIPKV